MSSNENTTTSAAAVAAASSTNAITSDTETSNTTTTFNPLLRVVFIAKVFRFLQQDHIVVSKFSGFTETKTQVKYIPRLLQLGTVNSSWSDTVINFSSIPSSVVSRFCEHLDKKYSSFVRNDSDNNLEENVILLSIRDALLWIGHFVKDLHCVKSYSLVLKKLLASENSRDGVHRSRINLKLFSTDIFKEILVEISEFTTTTTTPQNPNSAHSAGYWCSMIELLLTYKEVRESFSNVIFGNVIFKQQSVPENPVVENPIIDNRILLGGEEICRCFIKIFNSASWMKGFSIKTWCKAIANITSLEENREVYATKEFSETLCSVAAKLIVESSNSSGGNNNSSGGGGRKKRAGGRNNNGKSGFNSDFAGDAFLEIIRNLTSNNDNNSADTDNNNSGDNNSIQKLLAVEVIRDVMLKLSNIFVRDGESCLCWSKVFLTLSQENPQLFCIDETPKVLVSISNTKNLFGGGYQSSRDSIRCFIEVVDFVMTMDDQKCTDILLPLHAKLKMSGVPGETYDGFSFSKFVKRKQEKEQKQKQKQKQEEEQQEPEDQEDQEEPEDQEEQQEQKQGEAPAAFTWGKSSFNSTSLNLQQHQKVQKQEQQAEQKEQKQEETPNAWSNFVQQKRLHHQQQQQEEQEEKLQQKWQQTLQKNQQKQNKEEVPVFSWGSRFRVSEKEKEQQHGSNVPRSIYNHNLQKPKEQQILQRIEHEQQQQQEQQKRQQKWQEVLNIQKLEQQQKQQQQQQQQQEEQEEHQQQQEKPDHQQQQQEEETKVFSGEFTWGNFNTSTKKNRNLQQEQQQEEQILQNLQGAEHFF